MESKRNERLQELRKFMIYGLLILAVIFAVAIYFADWDDNTKNIMINILSSIIVGAFVVFAWGNITSEIQATEKTYVIDNINKALEKKGLIETDVNVAFERASHFVKQAEELLVIGTTKQYHHNNSINTSINRYLDATVNRLGRNDKLTYRRMTSTDLQTSFQNHLYSCLDEVQDSDHDFQVMMIEDFIPAYTYLIIDFNYLMVSLNHRDQSNVGRVHKCFVTEDSEIIGRFRDHFQSVWQSEENYCTISKNKEELSFEIEYMQKVESHMSVIKESLKTLPSKRKLYSLHVLSELRQTANRLDGIASGSLKVDHSDANGNMTKLFNIYFNHLDSNYTYTTITFLKFWKGFFESNDGVGVFLENNGEAIKRGARINRTLIIPKSLLKKDLENYSDETIGMYSTIIRQNILLKEQLPPDKRDLYTFTVLFTSSHDVYQDDFYNFALIKSKDKREIIIFDPAVKPPIKFTNVSILDMDSSQRKYHDPSIITRQKEIKLNRVYNEWKGQKLEKDEEDFFSNMGLTLSQKASLLYSTKNQEAIKKAIMPDNTNME